MKNNNGDTKLEQYSEYSPEELVKKIICEIKRDPNCTTDWITNQMHILDDIGFDSLQLLDFVLRIEEVFGIEFDLESFDYTHFNSVTTFTRFVIKHLHVSS